MKVLILDDEADGRRELRLLLSPFADVELIGEAATVAEARELTDQRQPDLAFVDVRLRGETAFDYVGQLAAVQPRLVFVTAYDNFAVRGFQCNALDYLMKPVEPELLERALERARRQESLERRVAEEDDSIFLRFENTARLVPWKAITHITAEGNYSRVHTTEAAAELVLRPLKDWLELAPGGMFVQVHRATLVRISAIKEVTAVAPKQRELSLGGEEGIPVSRNYWPSVRAALLKKHPDAAGCLP